MEMLIIGLLLFFGIHSVRIAADGWRTRTIARLGMGPWRAVHSIASLLGLALIVWGFAQARISSAQLWQPPHFMHHITALLVLIAFVLLLAAFVPGNAIKAKLHHPLILAVKTWSFAHLLSNGTLADVLLFGSFLLWSVLAFRAARQRDRAAATVYPAGNTSATAITLVLALVAYGVFGFWLHGMWLGVRPFG